MDNTIKAFFLVERLGWPLKTILVGTIHLIQCMEDQQFVALSDKGEWCESYYPDYDYFMHNPACWRVIESHIL